METAQLLTAILGAGGGGAVLLALVNGLVKWFSGASHRERLRNNDLVSQRLRAIEERDISDRKRREAEDNAALYRAQLIENGITPKIRKPLRSDDGKHSEESDAQ